MEGIKNTPSFSVGDGQTTYGIYSSTDHVASSGSAFAHYGVYSEVKASGSGHLAQAYGGYFKSPTGQAFHSKAALFAESFICASQSESVLMQAGRGYFESLDVGDLPIGTAALGAFRCKDSYPKNITFQDTTYVGLIQKKLKVYTEENFPTTWILNESEASVLGNILYVRCGGMVTANISTFSCGSSNAYTYPRCTIPDRFAPSSIAQTIPVVIRLGTGCTLAFVMISGNLMTILNATGTAFSSDIQMAAFEGTIVVNYLIA